MTSTDDDAALDAALDLARRTPPRTISMGGDLDPSMSRTAVLPPAGAPPADALPQIQALWRRCGGVELLRDKVYGGGIVVLSPADAQAERQELLTRGYDLGQHQVLAAYHGEQLWALLGPDGVRILEPLDPPEEWPLVAPSIAEFIVRTLEGPHEKFWVQRPAAAAA